MPLITKRTAVTASTQSENVVEGSSFEFLINDSIVRLNMVVARPLNYHEVQSLFQIGGQTLIQPPFGLVFPVEDSDEGGTDPSIPNDLYHVYIQRAAAAGERLFLSFLNEGAATAQINWMIRIDGV